jgi:hypothetical protein
MLLGWLLAESIKLIHKFLVFLIEICLTHIPEALSLFFDIVWDVMLGDEDVIIVDPFCRLEDIMGLFVY